MPQVQLPMFPVGVTHITPELGFERRDGKVTYFVGTMPVFLHDEDDLRTFRMITSQFVVNGHARQADIVRAFGVPPISVKRAVKRYREEGPAGFYKARRPRGPKVLTPDVVKQLEDLLFDGAPKAEAARQLGLKPDTVRKAILDGRVRGKKSRPKPSPAMRGR